MNKSTKWIVGIIVVVVVVAIGYFVSRGPSEPGSTEPVKIGATLPLTGDLAFYGEALRNGMLLAEEEINSKGGIDGRELKILIQDNKGKPKTAVSDVTYLINVEKVPAILNSFEHLTLASRDVVEKAGIPMIAFTVKRFTREDNPQYTFRDYWDMGRVGESFGKAANNIGSKRVGMIVLQDTSQANFKSEFLKVFKGDVIAEEIFLYGARDFRTQLSKLKGTGADTIVVYALPVEASLILRQMSELGMSNIKLLTTEGSEGFVTEANEALLQKTKAISYLGALLSPENSDFITKYKAKFGADPRPDAFYAYEDVYLFSEALGDCHQQTDVGVCIKNAIQNQFNEYNNKYRDLPLVQYNNGWKIFAIE